MSQNGPSSPLAFPSSSSGHPESETGAGAQHVAQRALGGAGARSSSPLPYPSSSASASGRANQRVGAAGAAPLFNPAHPSSGASGGGAMPRGSAGQRSAGRSDSPLFFPGSDTPTPRPARRGDIHSGAPPTPSRSITLGGRGDPSSQGQGYPTSSAPGSDADALMQTDDTALTNDEPVAVVWGTTVTVQSSMDSFKSFLSSFLASHRHNFDTRLIAKGLDPASVDFGHVRKKGGERVYETYLKRMLEVECTALNLDIGDLKAWGESFGPGDDADEMDLERRESKKEKEAKMLYRNLLQYPQEIIPILDQVLKDCVLALAWSQIDTDEDRQKAERLELLVFKVRPFLTGAGLGLKDDKEGKGKGMRELNPQDIDKIVCIKGLVIRATPIIPDMKSAFFRCLSCSHTLTVELDRGQIAEPDRCPRDVCAATGTMSLIHNRCEFADRQIVRLQETPDSVPDGQTPHTVSLCLYDELVDLVKPGDRISLTGIFRSVAVRINPRQRVIKSLFKTYVDIVHIKKSDKKRMGSDNSTRDKDDRRGMVGIGGEEDSQQSPDGNDDVEMNDGEGEGETETETESAQAKLKERMVEYSRRDDIYEFLARSLAPSIWEMDDVKKGILLQLFGGTNKSIKNGGGGGGPRYRGDINVLLVGDPGTSKSQILQYVHKIAPRGVYTSGKGSSAVGLTAYVTRDPDSKQLVLESGALVLSDGGVCCIDEFDKMSDATRSVLHEVMEQQTVSIAKAGIITTLNARTSILAAANPVGSKYNLKWPVTRNIDLPPTLISRFDLLYLVLDKIDEVSDRRLAKHLVGLYLEDRPATGGTDIMKIEDLSAYISWARNHIHPVLSKEASDALVKAYVDMRNAGIDPRNSERRITATTRQLESMIRLSEAHARMRYSLTVEEQDVEEANRLIREALKESATDPLTGLIDLDLLQGGQSLQQRKMRGDLRREVVTILDMKDKGMRWNDLIKALEAQSSVPIDTIEFAEVVKALESDGSVRVSGERDRRMIRKTAAGGDF